MRFCFLGNYINLTVVGFRLEPINIKKLQDEWFMCNFLV